MLSGNVLIPTGVEEGSALSSYCLSLSHTSFPPSFWSDHQVVLWWPAQWSQCDTAFKWFTVISLIRLQLISLIINECVSELSYSEGFIWNQPSLAPLQFLALEKNIMPLTSMFVCVCVFLQNIINSDNDRPRASVTGRPEPSTSLCLSVCISSKEQH